PAMKSTIQDFKEKNLKLLKRAKRGDRTAKKKLRNMGLLYWEHHGRVIVKRACANNGERNGAIPWSFCHKQI
ncbi:MAG: hypothetical protein ACE5MG_12450, partial [Candidatus Methylomirabilales bacterium]